MPANSKNQAMPAHRNAYVWPECTKNNPKITLTSILSSQKPKKHKKIYNIIVAPLALPIFRNSKL
ncbi:hypothetical protein A8C56_14775 [Niabella ginsenosidivorans]|uniref:Uncharacterized protein n=1 Tax=Niabella ginsenosidivorans TaxID=1176587 RepID=A0A1A9I327_9BACT|nr:hypothetical protein A8C56_14775 [Niabella ginsenosidivorans]